MTENLIEPFLTAIETLSKRLADPEQINRRHIGYLCTYTPVELIHAAGFVPVRLFAGPGEVEQAYAHVPDFICPYDGRNLHAA